MIRYLTTLFVPLFLIAITTADARSQNVTSHSMENVLAPSAPAGFGYINIDRSVPCYDHAHHHEKVETLRAQAEALRKQTGFNMQPQQEVLFSFPLATSDEFTGSALHGISNYVDHDPAFPNQLEDYMCGTRTYDTATGYNHRGIDYFTWPFAFYQMDMDEHHVVAAAPGMIIAKIDGHPDRNCNFSNPNWNAVYVIHDDNSIAWYGHMKRFSLTDKEVGDFVERGEFLGVIGSSGSSTGPHLHFEVYDAENNLIDPYQGPCNTLNSVSWWNEQHPYEDSAVNMLATHHAAPEFRPCPQTEIPNFRNSFEVGETPLVAVYFRDQQEGDVTQLRIRRPDGALAYQWSFSSPDSYMASYWFWTTPIPAGSPLGTYRFEVTYRGVVHQHEFQYGGPPVSVAPERDLPNQIMLSQPYPNPFNPSTQFELMLPESQHIRIDVVNLSGSIVATLQQGTLQAGENHVFSFDAQNLASGIYLLRVQGESFLKTRKMTLVK